MYNNYILPDVTSALPLLLRELAEAPIVGSRAGRTRELTHIGITLDFPLRREVLVPGRRANIVAQIAESAWVLAGRNDIGWLSNYLPRARDFSDDGTTWSSGYGPRLRNFHGVDQLAEVVDRLREDPETRRAVAVLWDPQVDTLPGRDIACNDWLSFLGRDGILDLHVAVRSNDIMWGWSGINTFEWSVLLEVVAGLVGMRVGSLHFSTTSFHLYERHWQRAAGIDGQPPLVTDSPRFNVEKYRTINMLDHLLDEWFEIEEHIREGQTAWSAIDNFPEPMLQSWLRVLDWWWNANEAGMAPLRGTALEAACYMGLRPPWQEEMAELRRAEKAVIDAVFPEQQGRDGQIQVKRGDRMVWEDPPPRVSDFLRYAIALHNDKHAAYGDSWKKRGEVFSIIPNIARKIDRLGNGTIDETSADTALDLMVYLAKYRTWLDEQEGRRTNSGSGTLSGTPEYANDRLIATEKEVGELIMPVHQATTENHLRLEFELLEKQVLSQDPERAQRVDSMLVHAYRLARHLWEDNDEYQGADHD